MGRRACEPAPAWWRTYQCLLYSSVYLRDAVMLSVTTTQCDAGREHLPPRCPAALSSCKCTHLFAVTEKSHGHARTCTQHTHSTHSTRTDTDTHRHTRTGTQAHTHGTQVQHLPHTVVMTKAMEVTTHHSASVGNVWGVERVSEASEDKRDSR